MKYLAIILISLLTACQNRQQTESENQGKPILTVTIEPQRYFAKAIAGDNFDIVCMVPKGTSPENYDPTPQQLVALGKSNAYLRIGYIGFEQVWMDRMMENTAHLQVFDTSKDIDFILDTHHGHSCSEHSKGIEPHIWTSPANAQIIARNTYHAISQLDSKNKEYYFNRYDSLCNKIAETDTIIRNILSKNPKNKAFMIYHPALSYFARDYSIQQLAIEDNGKEPSPSYLKELIDYSKEQNVKIIFVQPEFDQRNAEVIAREINARIVPIDPLNPDWSNEMIQIAHALAETN